MNWRKSGVSNLLWLIYTIGAGVGLLGICTILSGQMGYASGYGITAGGIYVVVSGLLVLLLNKHLAIKCNRFAQNGIRPLIVEVVVAVGLLALGIFLRISQMMSMEEIGADIVFYNAATVAEGQKIPQVVHGATYIYLQLLHLCMLFFGNKLFVAVGVQVVLQLLAVVILYFVVRKLAGVIPALTMLTFVLLSPYMIMNAVTLSSNNLFLLFFVIALGILVHALQTGKHLNYLFAGIFIAVCTYLDIKGVILLVFLAGAFTVEHVSGNMSPGRRIQVFLTGLFSSLLSWLLIMAVDAIYSGKLIFNVINAWWELYQPGAFKLPIAVAEEYGIVELAILFALLMLGAFSFWCRRNSERRGVWIGTILMLALMQCFQMARTMDCLSYFFICLTVLAGIGVADVFVTDAVKHQTVIKKSKVIVNAEKEELDDDIEIIADYGKEEKKDVIDSVEVIEMEEKQAVHFLENPLPLPKKHESKVMDYGLTDISEDEDFDYTVEEEDDFDF